MTKDVICATDISKKFKNRTVLKNCSLNLSKGEALLLLGENGSGKSTLLRILTGLLKPGRGVVTRTASSIGYCGHVSMLYEHLTVLENIKLFCALSGRANVDEEQARDALNSWDILEAAGRYPTEISQGQKARVSLCRAFLTTPDLLLLDEPDASLDACGTETLLYSIQQALGRQAAVVIASHRGDLYRSFVKDTYKLSGGELTT